MNIALLSASNNSYSETFIQAHRNLKGKVVFFYSGEIPKKVEENKEENVVLLSLLRAYFRLRSAFFGGENLFDKFVLRRNLKKNNIEVGLAEYGTTGALCYEVFEELKIPLVIHFHGYDASLKQVIRKYEVRYKLMFAYASSIVAVSQEMKGDLIALGANPAKVFVNPYGPSGIFLSSERIPEKPYAFLHVGRFTEKKAPAIMIKAFALCLKSYPAVRLWMIGEGALLENCQKLTKSLGIAGNVFFLGKQSPEEIMKTMKKAFAFTLHSVRSEDGDKEGTPVSILEAMAVGLPVISTSHAGIKDVVLHEKTGYLVEEHDVISMARYMMDLLSNPEKASAFGQKGRKRIVEKYTLQQHLDKINSLLQNAIDSNKQDI